MQNKPNNNKIRQQLVDRVLRLSKALLSATQMLFRRTITTMEGIMLRQQGLNSLELGPILNLIMAMESVQGIRLQVAAQTMGVAVTATLI